MLGSYINPGWIERDRPQGDPMEHQNKPDAGLLSRLPKPSLRQRRLAAMGTAAAVVVVGLGAFALLPPVRHDQPAGEPVLIAASNTRETQAPRILEYSAPFIFAEQKEQKNPTKKTNTSKTTTTEKENKAENI